MKERTTKTTAKAWLGFVEADKEVAGFGITPESVVRYNRLREQWIGHRISLAALREKIRDICEG